MKERRFKSCQHCYEKVRLTPSGMQGVPDRVVASGGGPECVPGLPHKVMPVVGGEGTVVG